MHRSPRPAHQLVLPCFFTLVATSAAQTPAAPTHLTLGTRTGRIDAESEPFELRGLAGGPHRRAAWRLGGLDDLGDDILTIEVRSLDFATFLQLVDDRGNTIAQDQGGAGAGGSRLVVRSSTAAGRTLVVVGLRDPDGEYEIELRPGQPPTNDPARIIERTMAALARQEQRYGAQSLQAAERCLWLARALRDAARAGDSVAWITRALDTRQELDDSEEAIGECQRELGLAHAALGDHQQALASFLACRTSLTAAHGDSHRGLPVLLLDIAQQQDELGLAESAIASLRQGIVLFDRQHNPDLAAKALLVVRLISMLRAKGDLGGASEVARSIADGPLAAKPTSLRIADMQLTLTSKLFDCGELPTARRLFDLCAPMLRTGLPATHRRRIEVAFLAGALANAQSRPDEVRSAVAELRELVTRPNMSLPWSADETACSIAELEATIEPAAVVARLQPLLPRVATSSPGSELHARMLGLLLSGLARSGAAGEAARRIEEALAPDSPFAATPRMNRDRLLVGSADAFLHTNPQLARRCALELARSDQPWPSLAQATRLDFLATCHMRCGDGQAAVRSAMAAARMALRVFERDLPGLPDDRALQLYAALRPTVDLVLGFLRQSRGEDVEPAYELVREFQARVLRGEVGDRRRARDLHAEPALALLDRLRAIDTELGDDTKPATHRQLLAERAQLEGELAHLAGDGAAAPAADLATLRRNLAADEAFVDYVAWTRRARGEKEAAGAPPHLAAFVVRREGPVRVVWLGPTETIETLLDNVRRLAGRRLRADPTGRALEAKALRQLADAVWSPLTGMLEGVRRVVIAPDGVAAMVPFAALPGQTPERFLIEDLELTLVASSSDLVAPRRQPTTPSLLVVGDVDFGPGTHFPALPGTAEEIAAVQASLAALPRQVPPPTVLRGKDATAQALTMAVADRTHVHLATHGLFDATTATTATTQALASPNAPAGPEQAAAAQRSLAQVLAGGQSGVALAGANTDDANILRSVPLSWLDLRRCELIVLSACETGLGQPFAGEQLLGLRRALRLAGAARTMTTLWRVEDRSTSRLIADFYGALWTGASPAAALRKAQLQTLAALRREHGDPLPALWAGFVIQGRP